MIVAMKKALQVLRLIFRIFTKQNYKEYLGFAQAGEDKVMRLLFYSLNIQNIRYLEIGTNDPVHFNNTYLFYLSGSSGVCIEANPKLVPAIKSARPGDICLNVGVAEKKSEPLDFYIFDGKDKAKGLSTFSKKEVEHVERVSDIRVSEIIKIPVITIDEVLAIHFPNPPDLISIDIEGLDFDIIKCIDLKSYRPKVFCVETVNFREFDNSMKRNKVTAHFKAYDYFAYAETGINTIFVDSLFYYDNI